MIERARWSDLTFAWFTADEEFGQNPGLRDYLEEAEIAYVMAIPKTTEFTDHAGRITFIEKRAARLAPNDWQRRACGIGTKGFRIYDSALLDADVPRKFKNGPRNTASWLTGHHINWNATMSSATG